MTEGTVIKQRGFEGLNLVIPRCSVLDFDVEDVPVGWHSFYPNLSKPETIQAINEIFPAVGYLFIRTATHQFSPLGTAFQLSPTIIATSLHVVEEFKRRRVVESQRTDILYQLLYTNNPGGYLVNDLRKYYSLGQTVEVKESFEQDSIGFEGVKIKDPLLKTDATVAEHPDFCLLALEKAHPLQKYFVPHGRCSIKRAEVYVLGVPGVLVTQPIHIDARKYDLGTLNAHVQGSRQHIAPGHILYSRKPTEIGKAIAYDCYTHKGNSGSPVVIHYAPELILGVHSRWSIYPSANIAIATFDAPFATSYVLRVLPTIMDNNMGIDQYILVRNYLDSIKSCIKPALRTLISDFFNKFNATLDARIEERELAAVAAIAEQKEKRAQEKQQKEEKEYNALLLASGLSKSDYDKKVEERRARKKQEALEKREQVKRMIQAKLAAKAEKRKRPDYDEYEFDEELDSTIDETDGKDFITVSDLSPVEENQLILEEEIYQREIEELD